MEECTTVLDIHDDLMQFMVFLLDKDLLLEFVTVARKLDVIVEQMDITKLKMELVRLWIRYFKQTAQHKKYLEYCGQLYELEVVYEEENINNIRNTTQLRFNLEEAKKAEERLMQEKLVLMKKSETDALTGLPNRFKLNEHAEEMFEKAYKEQKNLGIEMLDIDYFKEYNDTYGHQAGDEALKAIGKVLKNVSGDGVFTARYGGDEFMIIYFDKTDEQILDVAKKIKADIRNFEMKHCKSKVSEYVTISQGIRNTVPMSENKLWDYMFSADTALYGMKQNGRNGIYLVHRMEAASADKIVITAESEGV